MNNKQVFVYLVLVSKNDLRSVFLGHIYFKELKKFQKLVEICHCCMTIKKNKNVNCLKTSNLKPLLHDQA